MNAQPPPFPCSSLVLLCAEHYRSVALRSTGVHIFMTVSKAVLRRCIAGKEDPRTGPRRTGFQGARGGNQGARQWSRGMMKMASRIGGNERLSASGPVGFRCLVGPIDHCPTRGRPGSWKQGAPRATRFRTVVQPGNSRLEKRLAVEASLGRHAFRERRATPPDWRVVPPRPVRRPGGRS